MLSNTINVFTFAFVLASTWYLIYAEEILESAVDKGVVTARKKRKDNYVMPVVLGGMLLKSIILPLAFKAMAVMATIAVGISFLSLLLSSLIGFSKVASGNYKSPEVKVVYKKGAHDRISNDAYGSYSPYPSIITEYPHYYDSYMNYLNS